MHVHVLSPKNPGSQRNAVPEQGLELPQGLDGVGFRLRALFIGDTGHGHPSFWV